MNWSLGNYWYLLLFILLPLFGLLMYRYLRWKDARKNLFAQSKFQEDLFSKNRGFSRFFPLLYLIATCFLIIATVDIISGTQKIKTKQKINNVIFVLDVSNSMNAQDVDPDRLTEAKNIMIQSLAKMKNDKVGIVVFAGQAISIMPLTTDYSAAATYIQGIETSIMPTQGTDFLNAIKAAVEKFKNVPKGSRKIVMISDGEDNEGNEENAAKLAKKEGISIISVGVGTTQGAPVPEYIFGQLMGYKLDQNGNTVISKKETAALKNLASETGGYFVDATSLDEITAEIINDLDKSSTSSESVIDSESANHYYQYPLALALIFFALIFLFNPKRDFNI